MEAESADAENNQGDAGTAVITNNSAAVGGGLRLENCWPSAGPVSGSGLDSAGCAAGC